MGFSKEQWQTLSERFNKNTFTGKLILIKSNPEIFKLEYDGDCFWLRIHDKQAQFKEFDRLFEFPQLLTFEQMRDLFSLFDCKLFSAR